MRGARTMVAVPVVNRYRPEASPVVGEPRVQRNLLVLLADEDDVARSAGEKLLNSLGYDVIHAWSAGGAIERMRDIQAIKVAIVDWMLPGGVDKVVRVALIRARPLPTIVTVENDMRLELVRLCGALEVMRKPYSEEDLEVAIMRATRPQVEN